MPKIANTDTSPTVWNITVNRGDQWPPLSFGARDENGNWYTLTGATFKIQIKNKATDTLAQAVKVMDETNLVITSTVATFANNITVDMPAGAYVWDIETVLAGQSLPNTLFTGTVNCNQDVARAT